MRAVGVVLLLAGCTDRPSNTADDRGGVIPAAESASVVQTTASGGYDARAERSHVRLGIADSHPSLRSEVANALLRVANGAERCAGALARERKLSSGATRMRVSIDGGGGVESIAVTTSADALVVQNTVLCILPHVKMLVFAESSEHTDAGVRMAKSASREFTLEALFVP